MENQTKGVEPQAPPVHRPTMTEAPSLKFIFTQPIFRSSPSFRDPRCYVRGTEPVYPEPKRKKPHQIFDKKTKKQIAHTALWFNMMKWEVPRIIDLMGDVDERIDEVMRDNCITLEDVFGEPDAESSETGSESSSSVATTGKKKQANTKNK